MLTVISLLILAVLCLPLALAAVTADSFSGGHGAASLASIGLMGAPLMLRSAASEHEGGGGGDSVPDVAAALATIDDKTLPMSQRLSVAMQALRGVDPTNQLAQIKTDLTNAQSDLQSKQSEIATLQSELEQATARIAALTTDVTEAQAATAAAETRANELANKEQDLQKRVDAKVKEELAAKGFPAAKLPGSTDQMQPEVPKSKAELETKLAECKTQGERSAILRAFKSGLN
jgi:hypothetical protein